MQQLRPHGIADTKRCVYYWISQIRRSQQPCPPPHPPYPLGREPSINSGSCCLRGPGKECQNSRRHLLGAWHQAFSEGRDLPRRPAPGSATAWRLGAGIRQQLASGRRSVRNPGQPLPLKSPSSIKLASAQRCIIDRAQALRGDRRPLAAAHLNRRTGPAEGRAPHIDDKCLLNHRDQAFYQPQGRLQDGFMKRLLKKEAVRP